MFHSSQTNLSVLRQFYETKLFDECLPFWLTHGVDREYGGIMTSLDRDGSLVDDDKGVWQQGRFTWLMGELVNDPRLQTHAMRTSWLDAARASGEFLKQHGFDPSDGRMWFHVDRKGTPIRKRRYAFSESFAAIAFGELFQATGEQPYKELASKCFQRFLDHHGNAGGSPTDSVEPKFTNHRKLQSIGFPMISIVTAQELRKSIDLKGADATILGCIRTIEDLFVKEAEECVMETVGEHGEIIDHFDGRTLNPGHAIEAAWFLMEEGRLKDDQSLIGLGIRMLNWMFARGWDNEHGGLLYFVDVRGLPVQEYWHDMKFWWPHNEALIASLLAYELSGDPTYLKMHQQIHQWAFDHFDDPEFGEWFGYLHRDGSRSVSLKGNLWKGPFHYPRMLLQCIRIIDRILKTQPIDC